MIEKINECIACGGYCCKNSLVGLSIFDVAKLLYKLKKYEFIDNGNGFGEIKKEGANVINITNEKYPNPHLGPNCYFLNENGLCSIHFDFVNKDSSLGKLLIRYDLPLEIKPMVCRQHPLIYNYDNQTFEKLSNCKDFDSPKIKISGKELFVKEMNKTLNFQIMLNKKYYQTGYYSLVKSAELLIKGLNF